MTSLQLLLGLVAVLPCAQAYSTGAPEIACVAMVPGHPPPENQGGTPPFEILVSQNSYEAGGNITVTLSSTSATTFRGFLIQARSTDGSSDPIGTFDVSNEANAKAACSSIAADCSVTHNTGTDKTTISAVWVAPSTPQGNLFFRATVVESLSPSRYWLDLRSEEVTGDSAGTVPPEPTEEPVTEEPALSPIDVSGCGSTQGCFRFPEECAGYEDCDFLITWRVNGPVVDFDLTADVSVTGLESWTAVAFSLDQEMGDDSVVDCSYDSSITSTTVRSSWNDNTPTNVLLDDTTLGLLQTGLESASANNRVQCSFSREIIVSDLPSASVSDRERIFNLNTSYYLLMGRGPTISGVMQRHNGVPGVVIAPTMVDLSDSSRYVDIGGSAKSSLVITHGSLMMFAWLLFVNIGVLMPRYYKTAWPKNLVYGKQIWFQVHRPVMVLATTLTIIAFIIIFVEVGGYSSSLIGIDAAHPVIGIVITGLALANPIMAIFRPSPVSPNRAIFNWTHFMVGTGAQVLAAVEIFIGTRLSKSAMSEWAQWVVLGCIVWHCLVEIVLSTHQHKVTKSRKNSVADIKDEGDLNIQEKATEARTEISDVTTFKTVVISVHAIALLLFTITLVVNLAS